MNKIEVNEKVAAKIRLAVAECIAGIADFAIKGQTAMIVQHSHTITLPSKTFHQLISWCNVLSCSAIISESTEQELIDSVIDKMSDDLGERMNLRHYVQSMGNLASVMIKSFQAEIEKEEGPKICLAS